MGNGFFWGSNFEAVNLRQNKAEQKVWSFVNYKNHKNFLKTYIKMNKKTKYFVILKFKNTNFPNTKALF